MAGATENGKQRIFSEIGVGLRKLAQQKLRAFRRRNHASMDAVGAKSDF
jgi:hypothetical protein